MNDRAALEASLEAALRLADEAGADPAFSPLLAEAAEDVRARPYLFFSLHDGGEPQGAAAAALAGVASLRLWVMHHALHPWHGDGDGATTRRLLAFLLAREGELARAAELPERARLRYATLASLHPVPPHAGGAAADEPIPDLPRLVERWEAAHRAPKGLSAFLREKTRQHFLFYRAFFFAPLYLLRRGRIRARLPAEVRANPVMLETFSAIEQLGPVLDNFVLGGATAPLRARDAAIADLSFLYMQIADEAVDSILHATSPEAVRSLVRRLAARPGDAEAVAPFSRVDEDDLASVGLTRELPVPKYQASIGELLRALDALGGALEACVESLPGHRRAAIRADMRGFFDHCFSTFLDELHLPDLFSEATLDRLPLAETQWHFYRKNNAVMMRWIALRMELLGARVDAHLGELRAWGYILASFQVFDDLKDLWVDLGKQPSYPLQIAANAHPEEYEALVRAFPGARRGIDQNEPPSLAMRAPKTVLTCLRLARLMALSHFDWFTFYVADYRWRRNWLLRARSFNLRVDEVRRVGVSLAAPSPAARTGIPVVDAILGVLAETQPLRAFMVRDDASDEYLAYVLDVVGYDHAGAILRAALPDVHLAYRFVNLRMRMPASEKAALLRRVLRRHRLGEEASSPRLAEGPG